MMTFLRQTIVQNGLRSLSGFPFARDASLKIRVASPLLSGSGDAPTLCGIIAKSSIVQRKLGT